jgi:hypothetical protein
MSKSDPSAEARSAKVETNPKSEYPNPKTTVRPQFRGGIERLGPIRILVLGDWLGFRVSDLGFAGMRSR